MRLYPWALGTNKLAGGVQMEIGELVADLFCMFVMSLATVLACKLAVKFQDNLKLVRFIIFGVWLAIVDQFGQGMLSLTGAVKGNPEAQAQVGLHYMTGSLPGTARRWKLFWPKVPERGQYWLDKASATGDPMADAVLANAYMEGDGLPHDSLKAIAYLKKILDNKRADKELKSQAALNLYEIYKVGDGVPENPVEALRYCAISSDYGDSEASYLMGQAFEKGEMVEGDLAKAYVYYKKSVSQGNVGAEGDFQRLKQQLGQR